MNFYYVHIDSCCNSSFRVTGNHKERDGDWDERFDQRGDVLAHAWSYLGFSGKIDGDIHFDDAESWSVDGNKPG